MAYDIQACVQTLASFTVPGTGTQFDSRTGTPTPNEGTIMLNVKTLVGTFQPFLQAYDSNGIWQTIAYPTQGPNITATGEHFIRFGNAYQWYRIGWVLSPYQLTTYSGSPGSYSSSLAASDSSSSGGTAAGLVMWEAYWGTSGAK